MPTSNILQPGSWDASPTRGHYPERKYYRDAFASEFMMYWGQTKFSEEINELCFYRAITCFYREAMEDIEDRRRLLYYYLKGEFSTENHDDALQRLSHQLPVDSFLQKALKNICLAYKSAPTRTWGTEADPEAYSEDFRWIYREMKFDRFMQDAHRLAKVCNVVAARPWVHPLTGEMRVQILTPDMYRVVEERGEPVELWYRTVRDGENVHRVWTTDGTWCADMEGAPISGTEEPNPYGRVPFAFLRMETPLNDDPYGGSLFSLVEANLKANKKEFAADVGLVMNGFGVWVANNTQMNEGNLKIAPDMVLAVEGITNEEGAMVPASLEHVVGNSMFSLVRDDKRQGVKDALRSVGLPGSVVEENAGAPPSGISRILERVELLEQRDADKLALAAFEEEFAYLLAEVARNDGYEADLPTEFEFAIDYAEERIYQEPQAEYAFYREKAKNGDLDLVEYARDVMGIDAPDVDTVIEIITERRDLWKQAQGGGATPAPTPPVPPTVPPPTEEEPMQPTDIPTPEEVTDDMEDAI